MKHFKLLIAIIAFIGLPVGAYMIFKKHSEKKLQWYETSLPTQKDLAQYISASGRLKAQDQITVGSLVAGRVVKLYVDDNDFVKKDQVLVELDDGIGYSAVKSAQATLAQAKANLTYIEQFYKRQQALFSAGQLAKDTFEGYTKDFETAKAQVLAATGDLEINQQRYDNLFIKAPAEGIIIAKKVDLGQMITAAFQATVLFTIAKDLTKMEAEIDVDEADIGLVQTGQGAIFTVDAFPQKPFESTVKQINYDYKIIDNVITYGVILDVNNPNLVLRPGMTTNVDLKVATAQNALCVPNKALRINKIALKKIAEKENLGFEALPKTIETKIKDSIWILEDNAFKEISVEVGVRDGRFAQIKKGLNENTRVIVEALDPSRENPIMTMGKMRV